MKEKESLWVKVLESKYGDLEVRFVWERRQGSLWWRDLQNIEKGVWGFETNWFERNLAKVAGDGTETLFWDDPWWDESLLKTYILTCIAWLITNGSLWQRL